MVKCPFCGFDNEDGALFCEQCKSDLSAVPAAVPMADVIEAAPMAEPVMMAEAYAEPVPAAMPVDSAPPMAQMFEAVPVAAPMEAVPLAAPMMAEPVPVASPQPPPAAAPAPAAGGQSVPPGSQPKLIVRRGLKIGVEFPLYPEYNYIGRADDKPVDVDLEDQEPPDRVWCSRQHAVIHFDEAAGILTVEDLNSSNGTYVNRTRVYPGQKKQIMVNDTVQIGTVHMQVKV